MRRMERNENIIINAASQQSWKERGENRIGGKKMEKLLSKGQKWPKTTVEWETVGQTRKMSTFAGYQISSEGEGCGGGMSPLFVLFTITLSASIEQQKLQNLSLNGRQRKHSPPRVCNYKEMKKFRASAQKNFELHFLNISTRCHTRK